MRWLVANWFIVAIAVVAGLAALDPRPGSSAGVLHLDLLKPWLIAAIFLFAGLGLPTWTLSVAAIRWRAHALIQGLSFIVAPLLMLALDPLFARMGIDPVVRQGFLVLGALPTTIAGCVAFTRAAGGDEAIALCNSTLGNLLGIVLTPVLLIALTGRAAAVPAGEVLRQLVLMVLLPLALGQVVRQVRPVAMDASRRWLGTLTSLCLLGILYQSFCAAVVSGWPLAPWAVAGALALAVGVHLALLALAHLGSGWRGFALDRRARCAVAFCGSQKTLALGLPLLAILWQGSPDLALLGLPLLGFHVGSMVIAGMSVPRWRRWIGMGVRGP